MKLVEGKCKELDFNVALSEVWGGATAANQPEGASDAGGSVAFDDGTA